MIMKKLIIILCFIFLFVVNISAKNTQGWNFPEEPEIGDMFWKTDINALYEFDGTWNQVCMSTWDTWEEPKEPRLCDVWYKPDGTHNKWDGEKWINTNRVGHICRVDLKTNEDTIYYIWDGKECVKEYIEKPIDDRERLCWQDKEGEIWCHYGYINSIKE